MMGRIYMDNNATTPVRPEVAEAMMEMLKGCYGNPSTLYCIGQEAHVALGHARDIIAGIIGATPDEVVFTSGGTESDNLAIFGVARAMKKKGNHIITTKIEHHAVLNTCKALEREGWSVTYLPVDDQGILDPASVERAITDTTVLISVMHANNEIGTIQPIAEIGKIAKARKIIFHTDAVQSFAKLPTNVDELGVDLMSTSSHKIYGPKGVGFLYVRKGTKILPMLFGGHQERSLRPGTENVPGIVGFGRAAELMHAEAEEEEARLRKMRDRLWEGIHATVPHIRLHGHPEKRLAGTINVGFEFVEGESLILRLDEYGICVASGSACTSDVLEPSHVLSAIGIPPEGAHGALRISLGRENTEDDVDRLLDALPKVVEDLRSFSPLYKEYMREKKAAG
ncbi:MAG: cysteine desulfurase NifS [Nitrospirae bacterium]|nr:cysteine desulfurase NifS [Nitrospirota bacterium]